MNEHVEHLADGLPVLIPYLSVGHHHRSDPAASPEVAELLAVDGLPPHPYNRKSVALVRLDDGQLVVVAIDRLVHDRICAQCEPTWQHLDGLLDDVPEGAALSGGMDMETSHGAAMLVVDAADVQPE